MTKNPPVSPAIHVLLDTNALFTEHADKLLNADISEFILTTSKSLGLNLSWYLPNIVKAERRRQMVTRGVELLVPVRKLEKLLGVNLNITEDILQHRVDAVVGEHMTAHGLLEWEAPHAEINWERIIEGAVNKTAPFSPGDKEKGFKDAIILEAFCKLVSGIPKSKQLARVILVTNDALLAAASAQRTDDRTNVLIVKDLPELISQLNALGSHLDEALVVEIAGKAHSQFYTEGYKKSLYIKADLYAEIRRRFHAAMDKSPRPGFTVTIESIHLQPTAFVKKTGQTILFSTRATFGLKAARVTYVPREENKLLNILEGKGGAPARKELDTPLGGLMRLGAEALQGGIPTRTATAAGGVSLIGGGLLGEYFGNFKTKSESMAGRMGFTISWQATLGTKLRLIKPKLIDISASDPIWNEEIKVDSP